MPFFFEDQDSLSMRMMKELSFEENGRKDNYITGMFARLVGEIKGIFAHLDRNKHNSEEYINRFPTHKIC